MTIAVGQTLLSVLTGAVEGGLQGGDDLVVCGPATGRCGAVIALPRCAVIAVDVAEAWVRNLLPRRFGDDDDHHPALAPPFLLALGSRLGVPPSGLSILLGSPSSDAVPCGRITMQGTVPLTWSEHRSDVRSYRYEGTAAGTALITVGRGPGGRWDVWLERDRGVPLPPGAAGELLDAAKLLAPPGVALFASVPAQSVAVLQSALDLGFQPLGAEVLFCTGD